MNNEESFIKYVDKFDINDDKIKMKFDHSFRVKDLSEDLAKKEGFSDSEIKVAKLIGLFHDLGRFEQWTDFKTFNDLTSFDHGDYGADLLFNEEFIKQFDVPEDYHDVIYDSIKYHNKKYLPSLSEKNSKFAKLIRDADKIDILNLLIMRKTQPRDDLEIRKELSDEFKNRESVTGDDKINKTELYLLSLSLVFDVNYQSTFKYLKENYTYDKIFETLNNKEKFETYFKIAKDYINERLEG